MNEINSYYNNKYNKYVGARYVPIFDGEWDNKNKYEPLVIVNYQGNSYTSKTFVPIGIDINNNQYWALTGNYNAQVEYYRQETQELQNKTTELDNEIVNARQGKPNLTDNIEEIKDQLQDVIYQEGSKMLPNTITKLNNKKPITIAGLGDSIMAGYYANNNNGYMELLTSSLNIKFSVTVNLNNQGISGYTVRDSIIYGKLDVVDNTNADLYIISFGHNDIKSGLNDTYKPGYGYPQNQSITDMEYIIRRLRNNHPNADILILGESPYYTTSIDSNLALQNYTKEMQLLAIKYSSLFVDIAPIFKANPNYDSELMYDAGHPNTNGHKLIASELLKYFIIGTIQNPRIYENPTTSLFNQWKHSYKGWKKLNEGNTGDRYRFYGSGWNGSVATNTGSFVDIVAKTNCIAVEIEITLNTTLLLARDSINWYSNYTFTSVYPTSPNRFWLTIPFDNSTVVNELVGVHSARLYLRSGSLKIHQVWSLESTHEFIPCDSPMLGLSTDLVVTPNANNSQINTYNDKYLVPNNLEGYSITIPFVGTGLGMDCQIPSDTSNFNVIIDGVEQSELVIGLAGSTGMQGGRLICNNLPFGKHSVTLTAKTGNVSKTYIGGFTVLDQRKLEHSQFYYGLAKVGENKNFGVAYDSVPFVMATGNGVYPTNATKLGFTLSGTTNEIGIWQAEGNKVVY